MAIFIVSNRETIKVKGKWQFKNDPDGDALHDFRVAEFNSRNSTYKIIDDKIGSDYQGVIKKRSTSLTGSAYMFAKLFKQNAKIDCSIQPKKDVLVFIHGFGYNFSDNIDHIKQIEDLYMGADSNIKHLIYISWPSLGSVLRYRSDQRKARETGRVLVRLFEKLRAFYADTFEQTDIAPCRNLIHLAAHSMGNQVLYKMLEQLDKAVYAPMFSEVLLFNADAPHDGFEPNEPFSVLQAISERTHVYINKSDDALLISDHTKGNTKRLGRRGPQHFDNLPPETFVVDSTNAPSSSKAKQALVDHWGYLYLDSVIDDVRQVLKGRTEYEFEGRKVSTNTSRLFELT